MDTVVSMTAASGGDGGGGGRVRLMCRSADGYGVAALDRSPPGLLFSTEYGRPRAKHGGNTKIDKNKASRRRRGRCSVCTSTAADGKPRRPSDACYST